MFVSTEHVGKVLIIDSLSHSKQFKILARQTNS